MKTSKEIIDPFINKSEWRIHENSACTFSYGALVKYLAGEVGKDYALREVYPLHISRSHIDGDINIHDLNTPITIYCYHGKESIIVKTPTDDIWCTSFQKLYYMLLSAPYYFTEHKIDDVKDVYTIDLTNKGWRVLDQYGWTDIEYLTSSRKDIDKHMKFIKNEQGRSVIVTNDHPMIYKDDNSINEKESKFIKIREDQLFSADIVTLLKDEKLFHKKCIDLLPLLPPFIKGKRIYVDSYPIEMSNKDENIKTVQCGQSVMPRYFPLTEEIGFAIGFIIAEGTLGSNSTYGVISFPNRCLEDITRVTDALRDIGCACAINTIEDKPGMFNVSIYNSVLAFVLKKVMGISDTFLNKSIPYNILEYNKDFIRGLIAGIMDGNGSINGNKTSIDIRVASRTILEQISTCVPFFGLNAKDISIEGQGTTHYYEGKEIVQKYPLYGISISKRNGEEYTFPSRKYLQVDRATKAWRDDEFGVWSKVLNNKDVEVPDDKVYDITTKSGTLLVNGMLNHNCCGYSLKEILLKGVKGVPNIPRSTPAKHFDSILNQMANLVTVFQNEIAGAVAFNSVDTLLAPFIKNDKLTYEQVYQSLQNYIFSVNSNSRCGAEPAFSNITLDLTPPEDMLDQYVIIGGEPQSFTYRRCQQEQDMFNRAFYQIMLEGDADGRPFSYPIKLVA